MARRRFRRVRNYNNRFSRAWGRTRIYFRTKFSNTRALFGSWANRKLIGPIKYKHLAFVALGVFAVLVAFAVKVLQNNGVNTFKGAKEAISREMKKTKPKLDNKNDK